MKLKLYSADTIIHNNPAPKKVVEPVIISRILTRPATRKLVGPNETRFKTISIDMAKMVSIKIDARTTILVPAGKDVEHEKRKYLKRIASAQSPNSINKRQ